MWTITSGFKKFMRRLVLRLFVIFVVLAVAHVAVDAVVTWQLKSTINKLKTEGKLKPIEEIIPPIPDSENAASLYNKAFILMTTGEGGKKYTGKQDYHFNNVVKFVLDANWSDLDIWREDQKENIPKLIYSPQMQKIYAIIETASRKPKFSPGFDNKQWDDDEAWTYRRLMYQIVNLFILKTHIEAKAGNIKEASDSLLGVFRVLNHLQNYPPLFSEMTFLYLHGTHGVIDILKELENTREISKENLSNFLDILSKFTDLKPFVDDWKKTLVYQIKGVQKTMNESYKSSRSYYGFNVYFEALLPDSYKQYFFWIGAKITDLIIMKAKLNIISKYDENFPYYKIAQDVQKIKPSFLQKIFLGWQTYIITDDKRNLMSFSAHRARIEAARLGIALKLYRTLHGAYPDSLHALTPEILDKIPADPFTGRDFIYRKQENGFLLYSIGPDMKDDGGMPRKTPYYTEDGSPTAGDIVWKSEN